MVRQNRVSRLNPFGGFCSREGIKSIPIGLAIVMFIILDCSILGINYWITMQLESDAKIINLAGRQRMLSQRMTKALFFAHLDPASAKQSQDEYKVVLTLFSETLNGFEKGGQVTDVDDKTITIDPIEDPEAQSIIAVTRLILDKFHQESIRLSLQGLDPKLYNKSMEEIKDLSLALLTKMNDLTTRSEALSREKTQKLRWIQTLAFLFALFNFGLIIKLYQQKTSQAEMQVGNFLQLLDNVATALIVLDTHNNIILANKHAQAIFGYSQNAFVKLQISDLLGDRGIEPYAIRSDGTRFRIDILENLYNLNETLVTVLTINDISRFTDEQSRLAYLANHDGLTGLVNRRAFYDRLYMEIKRARRAGTMLTILFLDLNRFKDINDKYGHAMGDEVLLKVSKMLRLAMRDTDTVARYAGDEFVILVPDMQGLKQIDHIERKIRALFDSPIRFGDKQFMIGGGIGVSTYPLEGETATELVELADHRMYEDKKRQSG